MTVYKVLIRLQASVFFLLISLLLNGCAKPEQKAEQRTEQEVESAINATESLPAAISTEENEAQRPNILLIVADDLGHSDLGSFGGEINTPNLDSLAYQGIRFTNFQAAPTCSPTRSMLLTGTDNHTAGLGNMAEEMSPNQENKPGYEGHLNNRVVSVATLLRDSGYHTYMTGKWHLGGTEETSAAARGFERSFILIPGGASHYADMKPAVPMSVDAKARYRKDFTLLDELPDNFEYSSQFYVDELIEYMEQDKASDNPFFAYLAFTAPHWPLQAPDEAIEKYEGKYDQGYDQLMEQRLNAQKQLGLVPETALSAVRPPKGKPWNNLTDKARLREVRKMEIYAAMVDQLDVHTGRLIDYLKASGQYDNTLIVFMSDNGAEGHDIDDTFPAEHFPKIREAIDSSHDFSYENIGKPNSYEYLGPNWAWASQPAFRGFKALTSEGGTRVSAFAHFPKQLQAGQISHDLVSVKDITPTLLELTGVPQPNGQYKERSVAPISGVSLLSAWSKSSTQASTESQERVLGMELMGKRAIRQGNWKLVHMPEPYGTDSWQLYDLSTDLAESQDLSKEQPDKLAEMIGYWESYASEHQVVLPAWISGY